MADEEVLPLDSELIKVLASDTRRDVLRHLQARPMTVTELARVLGLKKPTVSEHLNKLTEAGLVSRREDGRLWVYYELTRSGKKLVSPGRTRFYLIMATTALAALVGLAIALAFLWGGADDPSFSRSEDPLAVEVEGGQVFAGAPFSLQAYVQGADGTPTSVQAYLLTPEEAARLQEEGGEAVGTPLSTRTQEPAASQTSASAGEGMAAEAEADASEESARKSDALMAEAQPSPFLELTASGTIPPGTYYLYVRDAAGRDNLVAMPAIEVRPLGASVSPTTWWRGLDGNVTITLEGPALDGTAILDPIADGDDAPALSVPLTAGTAQVGHTALDGLSTGAYEVHVLPAGERSFQRTGTLLTVRAPQIAVFPLHLPEGGAETSVRVTVLAGERPTGDLPVRVDGRDVVADGTGADDLLVLVPTASPGPHTVEVGRLHVSTVEVHPVLAPTIEARGDDTLDILLANATGAPVAQVAVLLDGEPVGFTNASGALSLPRPEPGEHRLAFQTPAGHRSVRSVLVEGWNVTEAPRPVTVTSQVLPSAPGTASLEVRTDAPEATEDLALVGRLNGTVIASIPAPPAGSAAVLEVALNRPGRFDLALEAVGPPAPPLVFVNRTGEGEEAGPPPPPAGGASGTEPAAPADMFASAPAGEIVTVEVEDLVTTLPPSALDEAGSRLTAAPRLEADQETADTPLGPLAALAAVALAALLARRRR